MCKMFFAGTFAVFWFEGGSQTRRCKRGNADSRSLSDLRAEPAEGGTGSVIWAGTPTGLLENLLFFAARRAFGVQGAFQLGLPAIAGVLVKTGGSEEIGRFWNTRTLPLDPAGSAHPAKFCFSRSVWTG